MMFHHNMYEMKNRVQICNMLLTSCRCILASICCILASQTVIAQEEGLLGYWSFDDGTATDNSGNGHDGVIYGAVSTEGISGQALWFDGVDDYVEIPDTSDFAFVNQSVTFAAWVKVLDNHPNYRKYISLGNYNSDGRPILSIFKCSANYHQGRIQFQLYPIGPQVYADSVLTGSELISENWYHVAGVIDRDNSMIKLYVNGVLQNTGGMVDYDFSQVNDLRLRFGQQTMPDEYSPNTWHYGPLDEIRIYDRALSDEEILWLYDNGSGLEPPDSNVFPPDIPGDATTFYKYAWDGQGWELWSNVVDGQLHIRRRSS